LVTYSLITDTRTRKKPRVTVGVCVRNCELSIKETIDSVINQDFPHRLMEIIFVDDGSEDSTLQRISSSTSGMDMGVAILHDRWKGLGPVRNTVVNMANGEYIVWVDGDMVLPKDHVRQQVEFMDKNRKLGIAQARYGVSREENIIWFLENMVFVVYDCKNVPVNEKLPGAGGSIYRLEAIREVGGFDSMLKGVGEDQDAAYRVRDAGWLLDRSPAIFYEKRPCSWKSLWDKYFWYGCGDYDLYRKNRNIFSLYRMTPVAGFVAGALHSVEALRLTHRLSSLLLPFHFAFKMTAWCLGFARRKHI